MQHRLSVGTEAPLPRAAPAPTLGSHRARLTAKQRFDGSGFDAATDVDGRRVAGVGGRSAVGALALAGAVLNLGFWVLYVSHRLEQSASPELAAFESAFPLADAMLGCVLLLAGIGLLKNRPAGDFLLVVAAAMALFLGTTDVTFFWRNDLYQPWTGTTIFMGVVHFVCVVGGAFGILYGWRLWRHRWQTSRT
jgi:hypothetical protein